MRQNDSYSLKAHVHPSSYLKLLFLKNHETETQGFSKIILNICMSNRYNIYSDLKFHMTFLHYMTLSARLRAMLHDELRVKSLWCIIRNKLINYVLIEF